MKKLMTLAFIVALALSVNVSAQSCSDLTIGGTQVAGGDLTFTVTGAPAMSTTLFLGSDTLGTLDIGGVLTLDIITPIAPFATAMTDMAGTANVSFTLPDPLPMWLTGFDVYVQALTVDFNGTTLSPGGFMLPFGLCTSDVESFIL